MQVPLSGDHAGRVTYVLVVPQAQSLAPHQANDKRYYKRRNFKSDPMDDYEVRDMMRRATVPNLAVSLPPVSSIPHRYGANEVPVVFREGAKIQTLLAFASLCGISHPPLHFMRAFPLTARKNCFIRLMVARCKTREGQCCSRVTK